MKYSLHVDIFLSIILLTGLVSCGNNQDENSTTSMTSEVSNDTSNAENMAATVGMDSGSVVMESVNVTTDMSAQADSGELFDNTNESLNTEQGVFKVSIKPEFIPVPINQIHNWILHIETSSGETVDNAQMTIVGGMPAHNHGMPTAPQATRALGNGDYMIEGMQFQMAGHWVVDFNISVDDISDRVNFNLILQP